MSPDQFLTQIEKRGPAPAYLFVGPEAYFREYCRKALIERALPPEDRETGLSRHDLSEVSVSEVVDDARSMSLFAGSRLIWVSSAEAALPRGRAAAAAAEEDDGEGASKEGAAGALSLLLENPAPGVVVVFDCNRYEFDGDDKAKMERVRKFYSAIPNVVEFARLDTRSALDLATTLAKQSGVRMAREQMSFLVEAVNGDAARIATEIEKLALLTGGQRAVTEDDILTMVPDARSSNIFALVAALGRRDRQKSLEILDTLLREGEYLPLALAFLATQCRHALVASEANLRNSGQIESHFRKLGVPMWRARAEQVAQTVAAFPPQRLREAIELIYAADKGLRDTRPDDRVVMEKFVLKLTER